MNKTPSEHLVELHSELKQVEKINQLQEEIIDLQIKLNFWMKKYGDLQNDYIKMLNEAIARIG